MHLPRDREVDSACFNCCLLKFTARKLRGFALKLLRILGFKPKSSIEQHFYDILKLKNNVYSSEELPPRRKALIKVRKMTLFFSRRNWHRVWERSTFNSKANFFASKVHILIVFLKKV